LPFINAIYNMKINWKNYFAFLTCAHFILSAYWRDKSSPSWLN